MRATLHGGPRDKKSAIVPDEGAHALRWMETKRDTEGRYEYAGTQDGIAHYNWKVNSEVDQ